MEFWQIVSDLTKGFWNNIYIFIVTLLCSIPLGLLISFGSMTKFTPVRWLCRTIVWIIRGTPLMLQLFIVLYVPGLLFNTPFSQRMTATLIAFIINYAAYFSEIFRGGIQSISRGQYEAGQVLGMTKTQIFFKVILLQVVKRIIPPVGNEAITLVKDTSLARVIAVSEIIMQSTNFTAVGLIWPLFFTGLYFLIFSGLLTILISFIEKKLDYFRG